MEAIKDFKHITLDQMKDYIEENGSAKDKKDFKKAAIVNGKYNHLVAVRWFCARFMPDLIPVGKGKEPNKSDFLKDW